MLLWSIQHQCTYEKMEQTGVLRADKNFIATDWFEDSYLWMAEQMKKRIGEPPEGVIFPVWAWYQWEGMRKRLDMRVHGRNWGEKGTPIVLLTIEVPDNLVLLSDDGDIIFPIDDSAVYSEEEKQKSWENIFDISCSFEGEVHPHLSTQATM